MEATSFPSKDDMGGLDRWPITLSVLVAPILSDRWMLLSRKDETVQSIKDLTCPARSPLYHKTTISANRVLSGHTLWLISAVDQVYEEVPERDKLDESIRAAVDSVSPKTRKKAKKLVKKYRLQETA